MTGHKTIMKSPAEVEKQNPLSSGAKIEGQNAINTDLK
jgi:hypothetical protein